MKFSLLGVALALCGANAQYFSDGWKPGQAVTAEHNVPTGRAGAPIPGQRPAAEQEPSQFNRLSDFFDTNKLMNTNFAKRLFAKAGINITEKLEAAQAIPWDERIPLITDDNYVDMVVNEEFASEKEAEERVWAVVVSAQSSRQEGLSRFFDDAFDVAYNETLIAGDLKHVRWARLDYLNVTYVTTKWALWVAPSIVIIQDRGMSLRFYRPNQIRVAGGALREFLLRDGFKSRPPWSGAFAPGGSREFVMHYLALSLTKLYDVTIRVPRWVLLLVSGSLASVVLNLFHGWGPKPKVATHKKPASEGASAPAAPVAAAAAAAAPAAMATGASNGGGAKSRKGRKK